MKKVSYVTVSTIDSKERNLEQSTIVIDKIADGYIILSAVSDGQAVHYILVKN